MIKKRLNTKLQAAIFDMDGVITKTAITHGKAWKEMFDEYLKHRESAYNEHFIEFSSDNDYKIYVDGRPRYEGVEAFLKSRNINIDYGNEKDDPGFSTICSLGNLKNFKFNKLIKQEGVELYDSTINLIKELRSKNIAIAVASSSRNCRMILEKMNVMHLFDVCVDGNDLAQRHLPGKPNPAIFTTAANLLKCKYHNAIVFEDAISGVQAGRSGDFGLTIGIAREHSRKEMLNNGADFVFNDLEETDVNDLKNLMGLARDYDSWDLSYNTLSEEKEKFRNTLLSIGNGYFCSRGELCFLPSSDSNYKATYMAGVYNRLESNINGKTIENEDLVNCGELWNISIEIIDENNNKSLINNPSQIESIVRNLSLRDGSIQTIATLHDNFGNNIILNILQNISMYDSHTAAARYTITPTNFNGNIIVNIGTNCNVTNNGVSRYKQLSNKHLSKTADYCCNTKQGAISAIETETNNSHIKIGIATKTICKTHDVTPVFNINEAEINTSFKIQAVENKVITIEKFISVFNSKQEKNYNFQKTINYLRHHNNYIDVWENSAFAWHKIWYKIDKEIDSRLEEKIIRTYSHHLMIAFSELNKNLDAGLGPRGLSGEAYRGHIFWDEIMVMPFYSKHFPEAAAQMLMYRYNRLEAAKQAAREEGYEGAMFPWQSGSDGREETQTIHLNTVSNKWDDDHSRLQRHVSLAIAYNVMQYINHADNEEFMINYGVELVFEICRFWASKATFSDDDNKYHIDKVMGPDEYHEKSPFSELPGLRDNAYTNIMVAWLFTFAHDINTEYRDKLSNLYKKMNISSEEINSWSTIASNLNLVIKDGIIAQYDKFLELEELDFSTYINRYGNIERIDRILKSEGKSPDDYQVCKQADLVMAFYNFPLKKEDTTFSYSIKDILEIMGYNIDNEGIAKNFDYYLKHTVHGSTLSKIVYSKVAKAIDKTELAESLYNEALKSDYFDLQGTTGEGIHIGVMGAVVGM